VFIIAALYIAIGLAVAVLSLVRRDPLGTFLGFIIVSGANVAAVVLNCVLRLCAQTDRLMERLDVLSLGISRLESQVTAHFESLEEAKANGPIRNLDLTGIGPGDPTVLAAATLDRSVYPRLVHTMDDEPPANAAASDPSAHAAVDEHEAATSADGPATKSLLRQWKVAIRDADLLACRAVYSALVDTAGPEQIAPLRDQLDAVCTHVAKELRHRFTGCIRERDFAGALAVGEQIGRNLPDHPIAREFDRIRPVLVDLAARHQHQSAAHSLA
jgi:hypothetical protein